MQPANTRYALWFESLSRGDVALVGGKNASLGEMVQRLTSKGVRTPEGFATTADAYRSYVEENDIASGLAARLHALKAGEASLHETGEAVRRLFLDGEFPEPIAESIREAYRKLSARSARGEASVAVRSSATAEDLPDASFAGQQETFLNVRGERELLDACRRCYRLESVTEQIRAGTRAGSIGPAHDKGTPDDDEEREPPVDLVTRAAPLIALLKRAVAAHAELMWEAKEK